MKRLHRRDLYCWSRFDERLNIDFNSFVWTRPDGNVVIDPLPLSAHDEAHLRALGGVAWVVLTNSDHVRATPDLVRAFPGARVAGPAAERDRFPIACDAWIGESEPLLPWRVFALDGSKTPGELALVIDDTTLITGDLVRAHRAASLMLLHRDQGLRDAAAARASLARLCELALDAILVGDGWLLFGNAGAKLRALYDSLTQGRP
jgi:glyoxylase-like metal-dependent hydrolase (beta-lactamase superfamily II)